MSGDNVHPDRRSTRVSLSIPVVISGKDADGNNFRESVRTQTVNKHGGKIAAAHRLEMGTEVLIENPALDVVAKARVVWSGEKQYSGGLRGVGLQLLAPQDVWGLAFPPHDWGSEPGGETPPAPKDPPASHLAGTVGAELPTSSLAGEEITIRLLQELQESADAHAREFQDRLKLLTHRVGMEFEFNLRQCAADTKEREIAALEEEVKVLKESLSAAKEEIGKLETRIRELSGGLEATAGNTSPPPTPLQEAQRQLTALTNSIVESMNRAAEAGLSEYRKLLEKENRDSAARLRSGA